MPPVPREIEELTEHPALLDPPEPPEPKEMLVLLVFPAVMADLVPPALWDPKVTLVLLE